MSSRSMNREPSKWMKLATVAAALVILLLPTPRITGLPIGGSALQLSDVLFLGVGLGWLGAVLGREISVLPRSASLRASYLLLIGYVAVAAASGLWAPKLRSWLVHAAGAAYLAAIYVMIATLLAASERARRLFMNAWCIAFGVTSILGVLAVVLFYAGFRSLDSNILLSNYGSMTPGNYPRIQILFENPNFCGSYLIVSTGVLLATREDLVPRLRAALPWFCGAAAFAALFTFTAGVGGVGVGAVLWGWYLLRTPRRTLGWLLIAAGAGLALMFIGISVARFTPPGKGTIPLGPIDLELSGSVRISIWSKALETFQAHPLVGSGLGHPPAWVTDPRAYTPGEQWDDKLLTMDLPPHPMEAHNSYLSVLAQLGVTGFVLLTGFIALLLRQVLRAPAIDPRRAGLLAAILGGFAYHGFFASLEEVRHVWFALAITGAYALTAARSSGESSEPEMSAAAATALPRST